MARCKDCIHRDVCDNVILKLAALEYEQCKHFICKSDIISKSEWISVEDRLPEEKINCLVYYKHAYCDNDGYWAIGITFYDGSKFQIDWMYKVTHWMPIPEPPMGKEN